MNGHAHVEQALCGLIALRLELLLAVKQFGDGPEAPETEEALRMVEPLKLRLQALLERRGSRA